MYVIFGIDLLTICVTGKGPQKKYYQECLAKKSWKHVTVITPWLEAEDYPLLLGKDGFIYVSIHSSSSAMREYCFYNFVSRILFQDVVWI